MVSELFNTDVTVSFSIRLMRPRFRVDSGSWDPAVGALTKALLASTVAKRHSAREKKTNTKSNAHDLCTAADLKAMLLELLSGIATDLDCTVRSRRLLTKICDRWQSQRKVKKSSLVSFSAFSRNGNNRSRGLIADGRREKSVSPVSVSQILEKPRASRVVPSDAEARANVASSKTSLEIFHY